MKPSPLHDNLNNLIDGDEKRKYELLGLRKRHIMNYFMAFISSHLKRPKYWSIRWMLEVLKFDILLMESSQP
jgi:hypothetical protein